MTKEHIAITLVDPPTCYGPVHPAFELVTTYTLSSYLAGTEALEPRALTQLLREVVETDIHRRSMRN